MPSADYLVDLGGLTEPLARVLKKLHKYRNKAYHRDQIRLGTLASATRIYAYLVCALMQNFPPPDLRLADTAPACMASEVPSATMRMRAPGPAGQAGARGFTPGSPRGCWRRRALPGHLELGRCSLGTSATGWTRSGKSAEDAASLLPPARTR